jgi:hypothetical protein
MSSQTEEFAGIKTLSTFIFIESVCKYVRLLQVGESNYTL